MDYTDRFAFLATYFQNEAALERKLFLYFYPTDQSVELFDLRTKKTFLKRCRISQILDSDLFIGAQLMIYGRQIKILDYGDAATRRRLGAKRQKSFLAVKPSAFSATGRIISILTEQKFTIQQMKMVKIEQGLAQIMFEHLYDERMLPALVQEFTSGLSVVMELAGDDSVNRLIQLIESGADPEDARPANRLLFGVDKLRTAVFVSKSVNLAETCIRTFFGEFGPRAAPLERGTTLCLIKPHAIKEGHAGEIIDLIIGADLRIVAMKMQVVERNAAEEFLSVYKGVIPEYVQMCLQLSSGPCIAMEILGKSDNSNAYLELRGLCGPMDPEVAQQIRPQTLRAKFGNNKIQNAVHCTDLEEDAQLEVEYFFKIID